MFLDSRCPLRQVEVRAAAWVVVQVTDIPELEPAGAPAGMDGGMGGY